MVCPRCITAVDEVLKEMNIPLEKIELGQVFLKDEVSESIRKEFGEKLNELGFELLSDATTQLISEIKTAVIQQIHHDSEPLNVNSQIS